MFGFKKNHNKNKRKRFRSPRLIELDSLIDTGFYRLRSGLATFWENATIISRRFRVRGFKRLLVEILDEGLTLGLIGFAIFTFIGVSVFTLTKKDWHSPEDFAVNFLDRHGNYIGSRGSLHGEPVPIEEMPDFVIKAVLATEDRRFFEHWGIDFYGLSRAFSQNLRAHGVVQGGSTLTQQLAKNLFLSNERTFERKIKEAYLAIWLEANLSKKQILQLYLDRAYMGGGAFGIAAASRFYFGKDIRDVSLAEAAMLAGLFKAPGKYAPHVNLPAARARANVVLSNLVDDGLMTEGQVIGARRHPASVVTELDNNEPNYFIGLLTRYANSAINCPIIMSLCAPRLIKASRKQPKNQLNIIFSNMVRNIRPPRQQLLSWTMTVRYGQLLAGVTINKVNSTARPKAEDNRGRLSNLMSML